jgi:hypothetical protein
MAITFDVNRQRLAFRQVLGRDRLKVVDRCVNGARHGIRSRREGLKLLLWGGASAQLESGNAHECA